MTKMTKNTVKTGLSNLSIVTLLALGGFASGCADDGGDGADSADSAMDSETDSGNDEATDSESTDSGMSESESDSGDGDGDTTETTGDGDGDTTETTGDGDSGDGDGDTTETTGDGDSGDGDGDTTETTGDGDSTTGDGDSTTGDGDTGMADNCGDGVLDEGEACDDGNDFDIDGCTSECEITPDVVAFWQFNEEDESNGIPDLTGDFDLDYVAGDTPGLSGGMAPSQGRGGAWYTYPGSTRHGDVEGKPLDNFSGTIAGWLKPPGAGNSDFILVYWQGEAGGNGWGGENETHLGIRDDNRFTFRRHNCQVDSSTYTFTGDGWYHVAATWEQTGQPPNAQITCRLNISNGTATVENQSNQVAAPQTSVTEDTTSYFGRSGSDADPRHFRGYVDELIVFDRDLSALELASLRAGQDSDLDFQ
jgi:cysteine-rich repeat protein